MERRILLALTFACTGLFGCADAQISISLAEKQGTKLIDDIETIEAITETSISSGMIEMATVSEKEYAMQQLESVQVILLDAWTTDNPENYFVRYFSAQRKYIGEDTDVSVTTYVILMEYPEMDNEWKFARLPKFIPLKEGGSVFDWMQQNINYYRQSYGGKTAKVVCTVDYPGTTEKARVRILDSRFDDVFLDKEISKDQQKDFQYAKTGFSEPDALNYIKDRWYITVNDWKSSSGSVKHNGKNYSYVNYTTSYAPVSVGLDKVFTSDDVAVTVGCQLLHTFALQHLRLE